MPRARALIAVIFASALALGGCAYMRALIGLGPMRPKVTVTDIAITKASFATLDLLVAIRVDNPNDFDLNFAKVRYQMVAVGETIASGVYDKRISIPEKGRSEIKLPLSIDAVAALKLVSVLFQTKDDVVAVMTAVADFETPFGAMAVDFEDKRPLRKLAGF